MIVFFLFIILPAVSSSYSVDTKKKFSFVHPNSLDFKITSDEGHFHHWKYSVMYRERLSHWPYWLNVANADFAVKKLERPAKGPLYTIESNHSTCFFGGFYCRK